MATVLPRWAAKYPELGTGPIPVEPYIEPALLDFEREHVFRRSWLNVGHADEAPTPGTYFVRDIDLLGVSILVMHAKDGQLRAFHNVCSHRGNRVVWDGAGSCRGYVSCCFHGWTYDLEGKLCGVLDEENFVDLDRSTLGLTPVHMESWRGFLFVNLQETPDETLEEYLGGVVDETRDHELEKLRYTFRFDADDRANWKVAVDAQNELYHLPVLGPVHGAFTDLLETNEEGCTRFADFRKIGKHTVWTSRVNPTYTPVGVDRLVGQVPVTPVEMDLGGIFNFYVIWPNFVLGLLPGYAFTYNFWPHAVDHTTWEIRTYFPKARNAAELVAQHYNKTRLRDVQVEDIQGHENVHRGMASRAKKQFLLQDEEVQIRSFHYTWQQCFRAAQAETAGVR